MGFLQRLLRNVFRDGKTTVGTSSFDRLSEEELETHLGIVRYGDFVLTDAIRPSYDVQVPPTQGFRHDVYRDEASKTNVPVLMGAASSTRLFELFLDLLDPLGTEADVVLETSHNQDNRGHTDLYREHIDLPVLKSILCEYEDLLTDDGCTGIAVLNPAAPLEVQFDEHKLLIVYGHDLKPFEKIFERHGVNCREQMKFVTEAEHVHSSSDYFAQRFEELKTELGIDTYSETGGFDTGNNWGAYA